MASALFQFIFGVFWFDGGMLVLVAQGRSGMQGGIICAGGVHMKTRAIIGAVGALILMAAIPLSMAAKEATVTLEITGMT